MRGLILLILSLILQVQLAGPAVAQLPGAPLNVPAELVAETAQPAPGQAVTLAFSMKPEKGWHGYWENPGDAGVGMQLDWTLPPGVRAAKLRYPVPEILIIAGLMNHVYEHPYALLVDLELDRSIAPGTKLPIRVRADWLACTDSICVPEGDDLSIDLVAGDGVVIAANRKEFDAWRAAIPVPMDQQARYRAAGNMLELDIAYPAGAALDRPYFFPLSENIFEYAAPQKARRAGDHLILTLQTRGDAKDGIQGLLRIGDGQGLLINAVPGMVADGGASVATLGHAAVETGNAPPLWLILGGAILGGLLLNLMPCVFPILGLKALTLAKMGGDARAARIDALAYMAGVMLSCLVLGGVMLALRAGGEEIGWAFQLQEPWVVFLLFMLMLAITANLAGLFELGAPDIGGALAGSGGIAGPFFTGILAAIVATPCTGPFMAAAMGAALILPAPMAMALFAGLGFGISLPYLLIAYVPPLRSRMPKAGPWLSKFRRIMAVPMALTALALGWLVWRLSGQQGLFIGLMAGVVLLVLLAYWGRAQRAGAGRVRYWALSAIMAVLVPLLFIPAEPVTRMAEARNDMVKVEAFSAENLARYRAEGQPVFVYFTADWCLTCKVNEAGAIQRADTAAAFERAGIMVLEGDFTRRDPAIARILAEYGRSGVPLYLYFPAKGEVRILPQILTVDMLVALGT